MQIHKTLVRKCLFRKALVSSLPVLMGYGAMGFAAGVVFASHGKMALPGIWGALTSGVCISGALQFMMADWVSSQLPIREVIFLTFFLNARYAMYGLSLLEQFRGIALWKKLYLIWAMTDETYALEVECKLPPGRKNTFYCLCLAALDHFYWIAGVTGGALAGTALPFPDKGIDFAMTALFLVILTDQCREKSNRLPAVVGFGVSLFAFFLFGCGQMLIPSMILMTFIFLIFKKQILRFSAKNSKGEAV